MSTAAAPLPAVVSGSEESDSEDNDEEDSTSEDSSLEHPAAEPVVQNSSHFRSEDADFIILSAEVKASSCRYKVHRDKLRAASQVFADMLSLGEHQDKRIKSSDLPSVRLTESKLILDVILRYAYADDISDIPHLPSLPHDRLLDIAEAAAKYGMPALHLLAENALR